MFTSFQFISATIFRIINKAWPIDKVIKSNLDFLEFSKSHWTSFFGHQNHVLKCHFLVQSFNLVPRNFTGQKTLFLNLQKDYLGKSGLLRFIFLINLFGFESIHHNKRLLKKQPLCCIKHFQMKQFLPICFFHHNEGTPKVLPSLPVNKIKQAF